MNKKELAIQIAKDLQQLAKSIEDFIQEMQGDDSVEVSTTSTVPTTLKEEPITLEKVRAVLAAKAQAGKQQEVKALITKHGGQKLTDLKPSCYEELLKEAEVL